MNFDESGWVKMHRKLACSRVFQNPDLLKVWIWCLLRANHSEVWVTIKTGRGETEVFLKPGQFIFGRKSAAKELRMKPSSIRNRMKKLENMRNLDMQPDTHYTIITITNWSSYQLVEKKEDSEEDRHRTTKGQPKDTDKNDKKEKKNLFVEDSNEFQLASYFFELIRQNNPKAKHPNLQTWSKEFDMILRVDSRDFKDVRKIIEWCQRDTFWQSNILSPKKLRQQFDRLSLIANGPSHELQEQYI